MHTSTEYRIPPERSSRHGDAGTRLSRLIDEVLLSLEAGTFSTLSSGSSLITDGPFIETKEKAGG